MPAGIVHQIADQYCYYIETRQTVKQSPGFHIMPNIGA